MNPSYSSPRRRRDLALGAEALESRELLTGGAGNTFAIIPGSIDKPGGTAAVKFTIDPAHFKLPRRAFTLGIDVAPEPSSNLKPFIASVDDPHGNIVPQTFHSIYDPHLTHRQVANGQGTSAVLTPVTLFPHDPNKPATYTVNVVGESNSSGNFLLGFYLPGDANGDGTVDRSDLQIVKSELGVRANSPKYTLDADVNRDGRIGKIDLAYTLQNQGVSTDITPVVAANLDPASVSPAGSRSAITNSAHFTGTASPGAMITYAEVSNEAPAVTTRADNPGNTTTADNLGNYSVIVPLANGVNTFKVTSTDAFGQTISGTIAPVTYLAAPVTASGLGNKPTS